MSLAILSCLVKCLRASPKATHKHETAGKACQLGTLKLITRTCKLRTNKVLEHWPQLGKPKEVRAADPSLNLEKLRKEGYDSVFAPRGSAVQNDEFVVFDPHQALPRYIIHYRVTGVSFAASSFSPLSSLTTKTFDIKTVQPSRCQC